MSDELVELALDAIRDPAKYVERIMNWPKMGEHLSGRAVEPDDWFQARAVIEALSGHLVDDKATEPFDPDWTVHTGATLSDWMLERGVTIAQMALSMGTTTQRVANILTGDPITDTELDLIALVTETSLSFWTNRERQFRADLAAGKTWTPGEHPVPD